MILNPVWKPLLILAVLSIWISSAMAQSEADNPLKDELKQRVQAISSLSDPDEATREWDKLLDWIINQGAMDLMANYYYERGIYNYRLGYYNLSNNFYMQLLRIKQPEVDPVLRSSANNNLGVNYNILGMIDSALYFFQKSAEIDKLLGDVHGMNMVMLNVGYLYIETIQVDKGIDITNNVLQYFTEEQDTLHMTLCYQNLSIAHQYKNDFAASNRCINKAIQMAEQSQNNYALFDLYVNRANDCIKVKEWELLKEYHDKALALPESVQTTSGLGLLSMIHGIYAEINGDFEQAYQDYLNALKQYEEQKIEKRIPHTLYYLAKISVKMGRQADFIQYFDQYSQYLEYLNKKQLESQLAELMIMQDISLKDTEIQANRLLYERSRRHFIILLIAAIIIILALGVVIFYRMRLKDTHRSLFRFNVKNLESDRSVMGSSGLESGNQELVPDEPLSDDVEKVVEPEIAESPNEILKRFVKFLKEKEGYKNPDLTLATAASAIGTNERYLSNAINSTAKENFNSLVNQFRINEAKRIILARPKSDIRINDLSMAVGFKNRQTFFRAFKQVTGLSPTIFIEQVREK